MAQRFIRCRLCGLPHPAEVTHCPVHNQPIVPAARMDAPAPKPPPPPPQSARQVAASMVGRLLQNRYRVTGLIAAGGMGVVYDAVQVNLNRRVAIKCLHPRYAQDPMALARFQNEAVVVGGFGHPNIVEVFDLGQLEDGAPFLVMERLEGETVTQRLTRDRTLASSLAVNIAKQTLSALIATHARGILHRDLKPDNLFLMQRDDQHARVKVLDFGVSRPMNGMSPESRRLTRAGFVMGTPAYMAPEQARGDESLDARADLYAVGMILYETLTGRLPFASRNPAALLQEIQRVRPVPPRLLRAGVPAELDALVMQSLAHDRAQRPLDAAAMLRALQGLGELHDPVAELGDDDPTVIAGARGDSGSQPVQVFARRE